MTTTRLADIFIQANPMKRIALLFALMVLGLCALEKASPETNKIDEEDLNLYFLDDDSNSSSFSSSAVAPPRTEPSSSGKTGGGGFIWTDPDDGNGLSGGAIAGIVIVCILVVVALVVLILVFLFWNKE